MQIIIPMSGYGERFKDAGYIVPKPLIELDGKTILEHVVDMFPGEKKFIFICNRDHLENKVFRMREIIEKICPLGKIVSISPHKLGPVHAVMEASDQIDLNLPTIVNYCDFSCYWNYKKFKKFTYDSNSDGVIPCYKGFHPHTLWSNYYAYILEKNGLIQNIQEKKPFTENPTDEFASSGTYFFKTARLMLNYFQSLIDQKRMVGGEYYVSMVYQEMIKHGKKIFIYDLQHFMQWGTPLDLYDFKYWSSIFHQIIDEQKPPKINGVLLFPLAGLGSRFSNEGYKNIKPLIPVSGLPMAIQAMNDLPLMSEQRCILRNNSDEINILMRHLTKASSNPSYEILNEATDGQATTCIIGASNLNPDTLVNIGACDNGLLYDSDKFLNMLVDDDIDILVWGARGYPGAIREPNMYGWIDVDDRGYIKSISVKKPLKNPYTDPIVVGTFTFKRLSDFVESVDSMKKRHATVNNEYYVDMAINDAIKLGKKCKLLEVDKYICWGTPNDLKTFEYWQSCFHKWPSHIYNLDNDPNIPQEMLNEIKRKLL